MDGARGFSGALVIQQIIASTNQQQLGIEQVMVLGGTIEYFITATLNVPTMTEVYKYAAYDGLGAGLEIGREPLTSGRLKTAIRSFCRQGEGCAAGRISA